MARAVSHPQASAGPDGAVATSWFKGFAEVLRHPWRWMTVDLTKPATPPAQVEPFERLRAHAASNDPGCVEARKSLRIATLRGLAHALGRDLPPELSR